MKWKLLAVFLAVSVFCAGCHRGAEVGQGVAVVSRITVTCQQENAHTHQVYVNQEKMRAILNRLRRLGQEHSPDIDPETLDAPTWSITLTLSDGSERYYQTKSDRYIRTGASPWRQADPKKVSSLNFLLRALPGDNVTATVT